MNDPTELLLRVRDSFTESAPTNEQLFARIPKPYLANGNPNDVSLTVGNKIPVSGANNFEAVYVNVPAYTRLFTLKNRFDHPKFFEARNATNPFENLGNSVFMNRAAIKLANIDAVYHLTGMEIPFRPTGGSDEKFVFADYAAGPGGFSQYLLWRRQQSEGFAMTIKAGHNLDWNTNVLNTDRLHITYGDDDTGDLFNNWQFYSRFAVTKDYVDLAVCDGGFDVDRKEDYHRQEFLSSRLIMVEILIGLKIVRPEANFVMKVFDTVSQLSAEILYLLSLCFERISIFKPISSRPANAERYVIAWKKKSFEEIGRVITLFEEGFKHFTTEMFPDSILNFPGGLPKDFVDWLKDQNNISLDLQTRSAEKIIKYIDGPDGPDGPEQIDRYDLFKAFLIWKIPGNRDTRLDVKKKYVAKKLLQSRPPEHLEAVAGRAESRVNMAFKFISPLQGKVNKYLDIGSGDGSITRAIGDFLKIPPENRIGVDLKPLETIPRDMTFVKADASSIPFPDGNFQIVSAHMFLHHAENLVAVLYEINRLLSVGGLLLIREHNVKSTDSSKKMYLDWVHLLYEVITERKTPEENVPAYYHDAEEWDQIVSESGLKWIRGERDFTGDIYDSFWTTYTRTSDPVEAVGLDIAKTVNPPRISGGIPWWGNPVTAETKNLVEKFVRRKLAWKVIKHRQEEFFKKISLIFTSNNLEEKKKYLSEMTAIYWQRK